MKIGSIFCLMALLLFSCAESSPGKRVYTEKDIEGYWATNNAIHGTYWLDTISSAQSAISNHFLRFYNDVCGIQDTVYKVSHDTVSVIHFDYASAELKFVPEYIIEFASKDRIMLREIKSGIEITYYSLYTIPESDKEFDTIRSIPPNGGLGIECTRDSLRYYSVPFADDYKGSREFIPLTNVKMDDRTSSRIAELYSRITSEDVLFARSKSTQTIRIDGVYMHTVPLSYTLEMRGDRGLEVIGSAAYIGNPLIRAMYWEIGAMPAHEAHEHRMKEIAK